MENSLCDVFDLRAIKLNLDGRTKETVFIELVDAIAALYPECSTDDMLTAVRQREEKMSTGISSGIAIPHAFCRGITHMAGAIGVSQQGIDYGALDNKPVHVVFLLLINEKAEENHLRILKKIFQLTQSEAITQIKNAKNAKDIHTILSQAH
jgi:PTS system fructose-specific IIC component/PTS system nitrogen regulatory IIA component